jgi:hypothetical protein
VSLTLHAFPTANTPWVSETVVLLQTRPGQTVDAALAEYRSEHNGSLPPPVDRDTFAASCCAPAVRQVYSDIRYHRDPLM